VSRFFRIRKGKDRVSSHKKSLDQFARGRDRGIFLPFHTLLLLLVAVGAMVLCPGDLLAKAGRAGDPAGPAAAAQLKPVGSLAGGAGATGASAPTGEARLEAAYGKLPLRFEANRGQTDPRVKFLSRGSGYTFFLTPEEAVLVLRSRVPAAKGDKTRPEDALASVASREEPGRQTVLRMRMVGASPAPEVEGLDALPGKSHYFIGNDPKKWRTGVPSFAKVRYAGIYPGIDLVFHGSQRRLEYDFVVAPSADPEVIRLAWKGAKRLEVDSRGELVLHVPGGKVDHRAPVVYQVIDGSRREIQGSYVLRGKDEVGFRVAAYDRRRPLVIDPVLIYSTYLGGSDADWGWAIAVDGAGNAYVTGYTYSTNFPTASPLQGAYGGGSCDVFVSKLNALGSALIYSTYLGGSDADKGRGIAVDGAWNAYVTGSTSSANFPTVSPLQAANAGSMDAFVAKLNAAGSALVYSTYLGGSSNDSGQGIAVDGSGNALVTGFTLSTDFPTASPLQAANAGFYDAFVSKLNAAGSALVYSTYLGGGNAEDGDSIAVDGAGNAYVTGFTLSTDFPTASPLQAANAGSADVFVSKLNAAGSALVYSTYLGGSDGDGGNGIAVDGAGNAYVTGGTISPDFPTASPLQTDAGGSDAIVFKLNAAGSALIYSTYLGGSGHDYGEGIALDGAGNAYVTGDTWSTDFPTASPIQGAHGGGTYDVIVAKLNAAGSALTYSTYLGGSGDDFGYGIAVDGEGNAHVTGYTYSTDFPTASPLQAGLLGSTDAFVSMLDAAGSALTYSTYLGGSFADHGEDIAVDGAGNTYVTGYTESTNFPKVNPFQAALAGGDDAFVAKVDPYGEPGPPVPALSGAGTVLFLLFLLSAAALRRGRARIRG
jgi:hypothetical protein